jgi:hypothetical protein
MSQAKKENFELLKFLNEINLFCSPAEANITFRFCHVYYEKEPPSKENLKKLAEPMIDDCLKIMVHLMGIPEHKVSRGCFVASGEGSEYNIELYLNSIPSRLKAWNSFTVTLFYKNYVRGIRNGYVDLYFSPELTTHWGRTQEPGINEAECLTQFQELEESLKPYVRDLALIVLGKTDLNISWQETGWQKEAMPYYGGDCIWMKGMIQDG